MARTRLSSFRLFPRAASARAASRSFGAGAPCRAACAIRPRALAAAAAVVWAPCTRCAVSGSNPHFGTRLHTIPHWLCGCQLLASHPMSAEMGLHANRGAIPSPLMHESSFAAQVIGSARGPFTRWCSRSTARSPSEEERKAKVNSTMLDTMQVSRAPLAAPRAIDSSGRALLAHPRASSNG